MSQFRRWVRADFEPPNGEAIALDTRGITARRQTTK
jgi:hypothetical protein